MQEKQVTIGKTTFQLADPFLVMATQNPIEQEGTYPLPEAQVDRFILKLILEYPTRSEEKEIMKRVGFESTPEINQVINPIELNEISNFIKNDIYMDDKLKDYIVDIVFATRNPSEYGLELDHYIHFGASPRATIFLSLLSRAYAFLKGRGYVTPQDIKNVAPLVLRHRVILSYEAEAEDISTDVIVQQLLETIEVP